MTLNDSNNDGRICNDDRLKTVSIKDREALVSDSSLREDCISVIEAGLAAADPSRFIPRCVSARSITPPQSKDAIDTSKYSAIHTVAFGKAADAMTRALNSAMQERLAGGIIVIPKGTRSRIKGRKFRVLNARHPTPDETSVKAAKEIIKFLKARRHDELVIFLISGGGSSLVVLPDGVTLGEKIHITNLLLKSGASIQEMNRIRTCISKIKGGKMAEHLRCDGVGLIMSDVPGDDVASVASGMTITDGDTSNMYHDALGILYKYALRKKAGDAINEVLLKGAQRESGAGTSKQNSSNNNNNNSNGGANIIGNHIIARNSDCLDAMQETAKLRGYTISDASPLLISGDIKEAAQSIYDAIPQGSHTCLVFGGEPTVRVLGGGTGGRNQELVLRLLKKTQGVKKSTQGRNKRRPIVISSIGTDGIDGNSIYAGAIVENEPTDIDAINDAIRRSDSSGFFAKRRRRQGGGAIPPSHIRTGPTHTNLMDVGVILT